MYTFTPEIDEISLQVQWAADLGKIGQFCCLQSFSVITSLLALLLNEKKDFVGAQIASAKEA